MTKKELRRNRDNIKKLDRAKRLVFIRNNIGLLVAKIVTDFKLIR